MTPTATRSEPWLQLIEASGDDRISFLQGQLTQDLSLLGAKRPVQLAASCDAKGRVLAVLTLTLYQDRLLLAVRASIADDWLAQLLKYRLRAKVDLAPCSDLILVAQSATDHAYTYPLLAPETASGVATSDAGWRIGSIVESVAPAGQGRLESLADNDWQGARLAAGIADVGKATSGAFTPHMLGLQQRAAISFRKGCYTGQEIVARTQHRGAAKRAPIIVSTSETRLAEGDAVFAGDHKAGTIAASNGRTAIAVIGVTFSAETLFSADGHRLTSQTFE